MMHARYDRHAYPFHGMQSTIGTDNRAARAALAAFNARQRAHKRRALAGYAVSSAMLFGIASALFYSF